METHTPQTDRIHNIALVITTIASTGTIVESITQGWEFWVPPLIVLGIFAAWSPGGLIVCPLADEQNIREYSK